LPSGSQGWKKGRENGGESSWSPKARRSCCTSVKGLILRGKGRVDAFKERKRDPTVFDLPKKSGRGTMSTNTECTVKGVMEGKNREKGLGGNRKRNHRWGLGGLAEEWRGAKKGWGWGM